MTEAEWLACDDPTAMLPLLRGKGDERKLRLFAVACCRELWNDIHDERCRRAVEFAERHADGCADDLELHDADRAVSALHPPEERDHLTPAERAAVCITTPGAARAAELVLGSCSRGDYDIPFRILMWWRQKRRMRLFQLRVLRDLVGPIPFRPVALDPAWLTSDVLALAKGIYDDRAFDRIPILADALQDAGCACEDVLSHCRDAHATHVRGCWVLDLLLGKS